MIAAVVVAAALAAAPSPEVVARVNAVVIDAATVARRQAAFRAQGQELQPEQVMSNLVDEVLLASEAESMGLRRDPEFLTRAQTARRRLSAEALLDAEVAAAAPPEALLREMYHSSSDFARVETLAYETREAAQGARDRLAKGAAFASEAKGALVAQLQPDPEKAPWLLRAQLGPAVAAAVFAAKPGATVGPVAAGPGFTIAHVLDVRLGDEAGFAARRGDIAEHAKKQLGAQARAHLAQSLRASAKIRLDEDFLKNLRSLDATPEEREHVLATVDGRPLRYADVLPAIQMIAASGMGGHMAGPTVRIQLAWQEVDARLLQAIAVERGYDRSPEVAARMPGTERNLLALLAAERIRAAAPAPSEAEIQAFYQRNAKAYGRPFQQVLPDAAARAADEKRDRALLDRVEALRKKAAITVDRGALARATSPAR